MVTATRSFTFEAAHYLPEHPGACSHMHGHSYRCEITASRADGRLNAQGMVVDFTHLKTLIDRELLLYLDHETLNDNLTENVLGWERWVGATPTAERIAQWVFWYSVQALHPHGARPVRVRLWETENSYVEVTSID